MCILIYLTYDTTLIKKMMTHHSVMTSLRIKNLKTDKFDDFSSDIYYKRASLACAARLADTLCPPEAPFGRLGSHWLIIREITSLNTSVLLL